MRRILRNCVRFIVLLALCLAVAPLAPRLVSAQEVQDLDPAADFRTAPLIGDGSYQVELVTGETVWVSVLFVNDAGFNISARLSDVDVEATDDLTLQRSIVSPKLTFDSYDHDLDVEDGKGMSWPGGETDTNLWFLAFTLDTTGQVGVKHTLEFTLEGFEDVGSNEPCGDDCTLDEDLADAEDDITELEAELEACGEDCTNAPTEEDLKADRDQITADIDAEEAAISELCGGELCDSLPAQSTTPWLFVVLFGLAAIVVIGGLTRTLMMRRKAGP